MKEYFVAAAVCVCIYILLDASRSSLETQIIEQEGMKRG